jgi:hypothetical protein
MDDGELLADIKRFDSLPTPPELLVAQVRREQRNRKGVLFYRAHDYRPEELPENFHCEYPGCGKQLSFVPSRYRAHIKISSDYDPQTGRILERVVGIADHGLCPCGHINHIFDDDDVAALFHTFSNSQTPIEITTEPLPELEKLEVDTVCQRWDELMEMGQFVVQALQDCPDY